MSEELLLKGTRLTVEKAELFIADFQALLWKFEVSFHVDDRQGELVISIHDRNSTAYADILKRSK